MTFGFREGKMIRQRLSASLSGRRRAGPSSAPPPPQEPGTCGTAAEGRHDYSLSSSSAEEEDAERGGDKPWRRVDRSVYEEQLEKMQEQLVQVMLENQTLQAELEEARKKPSGSQRRELEQLRQENTALQRRLSERDSIGIHQASLDESGYDNIASDYEKVSTDRERVMKLRKCHSSSPHFSYSSLRESIYNFLALFSEDARTAADEEEEEATPLTAKRLKENVTRLGKSSKPWREGATHVQDTLRWVNTAESLVVFLIYMYCVWNGWLIQLVLFIAVIKLSFNYLYISGLAEQFGFTSGETEEDPDDNMGLADKFVLVKQVAQTVQNTSGIISDSLEKLRNLVLWRQPEATRKLYFTLLSLLTITLFLPNSYTLTFMGLGIGMKLFIVDNIYRKYPRVQEEFDDVDRLWRSLPTDAELLERQTLSHSEMTLMLKQRRRLSLDKGGGGASSSRGEATDTGSPSSPHLLGEDTGFCSRFSLPASEVPFPDWNGGCRCALIDRDRPLLGSKGGRLYLTYSFLCFERWSRSRETERLVLPLADVTAIERAKPFAVLPGNGMAIEISLKTAEKYMFGAILNRDQTLASILEQGLMLGLPWGADPDDILGQSHTPSSPRRSANQPSSDISSDS